MKIVKGFRDITPFGKNLIENSSYWNYIARVLKDSMSIYNYSEIITPVLENTSIFKSGIGSDTDIVSKEMYEFSLKKDDEDGLSYCLRPEGTAPIVRSYIENSLYKLKKITAGVYENNKASIKVLQNNGFKQEGILRSQVDFEGDRINVFLFGKLL